MLLKGFNTPEAEEYLAELSDLLTDDKDKLEELVSRVRQLQKAGATLYYTLPGLPLCWKCTVKHLGQAAGFAGELEKYPERIALVIGELGHAYRECPDKILAEKIHETYQQILDTGCIPDFTPLLKVVVNGWRNYLQDAR